MERKKLAISFNSMSSNVLHLHQHLTLWEGWYFWQCSENKNGIHCDSSVLYCFCCWSYLHNYYTFHFCYPVYLFFVQFSMNCTSITILLIGVFGYTVKYIYIFIYNTFYISQHFLCVICVSIAIYFEEHKLVIKFIV